MSRMNVKTNRNRRRRPHYSRLPESACSEYFPVPPSAARPKRIFVNCHYCGYAPARGRIPENGACPKCGGRSWERFALAERLVPEHMK